MAENSERGEKCLSNKKAAGEGSGVKKSKEIERNARKEVHKKAEE